MGGKSEKFWSGAMRLMGKPFSARAQGFAITESLVSIALLSILLIAIADQQDVTMDAFASMRKREEVDDLVSATKLMLVSGPVCRLNMVGLTVPPIGEVIAIDRFRYVDGTGEALTDEPFIAVNQVVGGLLIRRMNLRNVQALSATQNLFRLEIVFDRIELEGPPSLVRSLPIRVQVSGALVQDCEAAAEQSIMPSCLAANPTVTGFGPVNLPNAPLLDLIVLDPPTNNCTCKCRITGWSCNCRPAGLPGPEGPMGPAGV